MVCGDAFEIFRLAYIAADEQSKRERVLTCGRAHIAIKLLLDKAQQAAETNSPAEFCAAVETAALIARDLADNPDA